jgi:Apea-like HEPN
LKVRKLGYKQSFGGKNMAIESRLKLIEQKFKKVISAATSLDQISNDHSHMIISHGDCTFAFSVEGVDHYNELAKIILGTEDWQKKFSEKYILNTANKILSKLLCENNLDKLSDCIEKLEEDCSNFSSRQVVYLPVTGICLDSNEEIKIGNVTFIQPSQDIFDGIITQAQPIIYSTRSSKETQDFLIEELRQDLPVHFSRKNRKLLAKTSFIAEPIRAKERAEEEVRRSLEVLRIFIPLETILSKPEAKIQIGLEGEIISGSRYSISLAENIITPSHNSTGGRKPFILSSENLDIMNNNGFLIFSELLLKENLNTYEKKLLRAVHWFSSSRMQLEKENALLNLITSIEVLLTPGENNPIGTAIAEGLALLLSNKFEDRIKIKNRFKTLYQDRSGVSHGGKKNILDSDIFYLINLAYSLLVCLCKRSSEFKDHESLIKYIEKLKLT